MFGNPDVRGERATAPSDLTCNIYVVSDSNDDRASLQALLSGHFRGIVRGFRSDCAFLEEADDLGPGVLLVDGDMPGSSGMDVLHATSRLGGKFVAIMLSGKASVALAVAAMKANAADFVERPCRPAELIAAVETALSSLHRQQEAGQRAKLAKANLAKLSGRETEVLKGLIDGRPNKQIAQELNLSHRTVEIYRANLMEKLGVRSLSEALRIAFTAGLFPEA